MFPVKRRKLLGFQNLQTRLNARYVAFGWPRVLLCRGPLTGRGRDNRWQQKQECANLRNTRANLCDGFILPMIFWNSPIALGL